MTRYIVVEENSGRIHVVVYEVVPTKVEYDRIAGHEVHPVLHKRYSTLEEGISAAQTVLDAGLNSGLYELVADTAVDV